ncbi:hypothetical protein MXD81_04655 [Microbacteriaceae bacterium K1510]|nr:hypothetical protein [Microbacteriaceae bacterium K1510]
MAILHSQIGAVTTIETYGNGAVVLRFRRPFFSTLPDDIRVMNAPVACGATVPRRPIDALGS